MEGASALRCLVGAARRPPPKAKLEQENRSDFFYCPVCLRNVRRLTVSEISLKDDWNNVCSFGSEYNGYLRFHIDETDDDTIAG
jgi:hypothetical protein